MSSMWILRFRLRLAYLAFSTIDISVYNGIKIVTFNLAFNKIMLDCW